MPARKNLRHDMRSRERIRTGALLRRLQKFALGEKGDQGEAIKLSAGEIKSIDILLRKTIPDLTAVEHSGEVVRRDISDQPLSEQQWSEQYGTPTH